MSKSIFLKSPASEEVWVGARVTTPAYVMGPTPAQLELLVWLDITHDCVVGYHAVDDAEDDKTQLIDVLFNAVRKPLAGPSRRPTRIRVATPKDAKELRARLADAAQIAVDELPEMDAFMHSMQEAFTVDAEEAFDVSHIDVDVQLQFYKAAANLWDAGPWRLLGDDHLLDIHCPKLGVQHWVACLIGNLGESYGVMLYRNITAYDAFLKHARLAERGVAPRKLPGSLFVLNFDRGAEMSKAARTHIVKHSFPIADANAYPSISRTDRDMAAAPIVEKDYLIMTACAEAIATFFTHYRGSIAKGAFTSARTKCKVTCIAGAPNVTVTAPHPEQVWNESE